MTSPTPTSRRDGEATRQRLLRAALDLYTTAGFLGTTTPAIAQRAGVAEGTIYRHFTGKEHLLNEAYRGAQRWGLKVIRETEGDRSLKAPERLQQVARQLIEAADRDPALMRMLLSSREDRFLDDKSRDAAREFREGVQQIVAMGKSDGVVRAGPAELWAAVWFQLVALAIERIGTKEWGPDHPQVAQTLEAAWDAIAVHPALPSPTPPVNSER